MAGRMLGAEHPFAWEGFEDNYDPICGHIASVVDGFEDFNVHKGCNVIFLNPEDLAALQLAAGGYVDVHSEAPDGVQRCSAGCGSFPIPGPAAALRPISPEANVLIPLSARALESSTPVSKTTIVRLEPVPAPDFG